MKPARASRSRLRGTDAFKRNTLLRNTSHFFAIPTGDGPRVQPGGRALRPLSTTPGSYGRVAANPSGETFCEDSYEN